MKTQMNEMELNMVNGGIEMEDVMDLANQVAVVVDKAIKGVNSAMLPDHVMINACAAGEEAPGTFLPGLVIDGGRMRAGR